MDVQMKRGLLDVCVLAAIKNEASYGYKIIKDIKPYIEQSIEIKALGSAAILQGFGSALCKTDEVFSSLSHKAYRGRALAVFRAGYTTGKVQVTVTSAGVVSQTFEIEVKNETSL